VQASISLPCAESSVRARCMRPVTHSACTCTRHQQVLHEGQIAEMATGEGKTLVAVLAAYLNALPATLHNPPMCAAGAADASSRGSPGGSSRSSGAQQQQQQQQQQPQPRVGGVHVVTVNDYLAARDAEWMGKVYRCVAVGVCLRARVWLCPRAMLPCVVCVLFPARDTPRAAAVVSSLALFCCVSWRARVSAPGRTPQVPGADGGRCAGQHEHRGSAGGVRLPRDVRDGPGALLQLPEGQHSAGCLRAGAFLLCVCARARVRACVCGGGGWGGGGVAGVPPAVAFAQGCHGTPRDAAPHRQLVAPCHTPPHSCTLRCCQASWVMQSWTRLTPS
jgi:hypothetical protein